MNTFSEYRRSFDKALAAVKDEEVRQLIDELSAARKAAKFIFVIGNGGSAANASHFCEDLGKGSLVDRRQKERFRIISLTDNTPYILAWANDEGCETIFVEQLKNLASAGDLLVAISGSGNSPNILEAVRYANDAGLMTIGVTGFDGGKLKKLAKKSLHVAFDDMGTAEAVHDVIFHFIVCYFHERAGREASTC